MPEPSHEADDGGDGLIDREDDDAEQCEHGRQPEEPDHAEDGPVPHIGGGDDEHAHAPTLRQLDMFYNKREAGGVW